MNSYIHTLNKLINNTKFWIVANFIGICVYLYIEYISTKPRTQFDELNSFDVLGIWFVFGFPILLGYLVLNFVWLLRIISKKHIDKDWWQYALMLFMICVLWVCAVFVFGVGCQILGKIVPMFVNRALYHKGAF